MKKCSTCKEYKEKTEFANRYSAPDGLNYKCKQCCYEYLKIYRKNNPYKTKSYDYYGRLKYLYGLDKESADKLVAEKESCGICGTKDDLVIDHDHGSGEVRGWLCRKCNLGIGYLKDNIELLESAANYLKNAQKILS